MLDELMPFELTEKNKSIIKVIGIGGGGSNAVNNMFTEGIKDVDFIICNTDIQALENSSIPTKIQLGVTLTEGLGAGNHPEQGREAAIENIDDVKKAFTDGTKMVFITAGMGGGTGTGAAPVIAEAAKELGLLTVAIVTIPFRHEGPKRKQQAIQGIADLIENVDSLLVINNEKLREVYGDLELSNAFRKADDILTVAAKGIAEIITVHGYVNVDFADVQTVMKNSGVAIMGTGFGEGENRAINAVQDALNSPLLNNNDITGAKNMLLNIISGKQEITMDEIGAINDFVQDACGNSADLIWGNTIDTELEDKIGVTVIATGFDKEIIPELWDKKIKTKSKPPKIEQEEQEQKTEKENIKEEHPVQEKKKEEIDTNSKIENASETEKKKDTENEDEYEVKDISDTQDDENISKQTNKNEKIKNIEEQFREKKRTPLNYSNHKNIDELENIPAYKRKKLKLDLEKKSDKMNVAKYKLDEEN